MKPTEGRENPLVMSAFGGDFLSEVGREPTEQDEPTLSDHVRDLVAVAETKAMEAAAEAVAATARADAAVAALRAMSERPIEVTVQAPALPPPAPQSDLEIENLATGAKFKVVRKKPKGD